MRSPTRKPHKPKGDGDVRSQPLAGHGKANTLPRTQQRDAVTHLDYAMQVGILLIWFVQQDDGWLRIVPSPDTLELHLKWKFNSSQYPNHYVYWRCFYSQLDTALEGLRQKIVSAREGSLRPTPDKAYEWDRNQPE